MNYETLQIRKEKIAQHAVSLIYWTNVYKNKQESGIFYLVQ